MRPNLIKNLSSDEFCNYYWLKAELILFCRNNRLGTSGSKKELEKRIVHYLITGNKLPVGKKLSRSKDTTIHSITLSAIIPENYKNDETHRKFFKSVIGLKFKFNIPFMNWIKTNSGKTYQDAVNTWLQIESEKKSGKKYTISSQFEYNQYTRDFFNANPKKNRIDAIKAWEFKKSRPGLNKYEDSDLETLD